jgi:hypothetical protein
LLAVEREIEGPWKNGCLGQRMALLELQRTVHDARGKIRRRRLLAFVEDREETLAAPFRRFLRIREQTGGRRFADPFSVVNQLPAGTTGDSLPGTQLQLARGIIAGMANDASPLKNWLHVGAVGDPGTGSTRGIEARWVRTAELLVKRMAGKRGTAAQEGNPQQ